MENQKDTKGPVDLSEHFPESPLLDQNFLEEDFLEEAQLDPDSVLDSSEARVRLRRAVRQTYSD
jgi:hypothetical protein